MTRLRSRLAVLEKARPKHDQGCTLEEVCRAVWRQDQRRFREMAEHSALRLFIPQFEREDAAG